MNLDGTDDRVASLDFYGTVCLLFTEVVVDEFVTINLRIGLLSTTLADSIAAAMGYGQCYRCKTPWNFVDDHATMYSRSRGCSPLCEQCWGELTRHERLPFYRELIESWYTKGYRGDGSTFDETWSAVEAAVLAGE